MRHISVENGGELIIPETGLYRIFFQRKLQGVWNYFKFEANK